MAKATASLESARLDPPGMPKLGLVPLDLLSQLGKSAADAEGITRVVAQTVVVAPPPNVVVASAIPGPEGLVPDDAGTAVAAEHRIDLLRRLRRAGASGAAGEATVIELEDDTTERLVVLGLGDGSPNAARQAGAAMAAQTKGVERVLCSATASLSREALRALCEGLLLASYRFSRKTGDKAGEPSSPFVQLAVASVARSQPVLDLAVATARSVMLARDLTNAPSNEKNPRWIAQRAADLAAEAGQKLTVFDRERLYRDGFGGILAVGAGSAQPPCLIMIEHKGEAGAPHVVLIGKGVTFDSGGLSLKPADAMKNMKTDMAGAGVVLGVMRALPALGISMRVTALLPCAENMPGAAAMRPGDVITHFGGRTSEVTNTDAEGRLLLADALAFAEGRVHPDAIVDVATLTGAAAVALGRSHAALFSNDEGLAESLERAGELGGEPMWLMPLADEYRGKLDSSVADALNTSLDSGPGAIQAALFLQQFVDGRRWAHLDIAGPARAEKAVREVSRGATGYGVRALLRWLEQGPALW
ncbi:MAG: leucyl aminopeptidase [Candidatus Nanopelagicales bacterium]|nr:leucyl aminopeptidase [Candidatus Nanopelagicales bacterium]